MPHLDVRNLNAYSFMFIIGTYIGIASCLLSAVVCWKCFSWRRRYRSSLFTVFGVLAFIALLLAGMATFTETAFMSDESLRRTLEAWQASGAEPITTTLPEFRRLISARNNSIIIANVGISLFITVLAGILAIVTFVHVSSKERSNTNAQSRDA